MSKLKTPLRGVDGETALSLAGFKAHDAVFIARYLSNDPAKNLTPAEANGYRANKLGFFTVWEDLANAAGQGYALGRSHAEQHLAMAKQCGYKEWSGALRFAVDYDATPSETDAYFDGVASVIPKAVCGPYGGIDIVQHHYARGFLMPWQTAAWSAQPVQPCFSIEEPTMGVRYVSDHAPVYQSIVVAFGYDSDLAFFEDYGQWDQAPPPPPDTAHYDRFPADSYIIHVGARELVIHERQYVEEWDKQWAAHGKDPKDVALKVWLHDSRIRVKRIRDRIKNVAEMKTLPEGWSRDFLGWRWQSWNQRYNEAASA